ncbi:MAG: UDP-N-acetylmuramoyl-L-alanyl-D-glutamate--2,6-diaminopimelate ligase [Endozoicomonadaceae bacterium]|nr:UDP-N-acetylmuramoyl-L-alanyl-D-glutamate--2,6-diaminopimelate ligase [Endozoicomonadaceae bacterium]
MNCMQREQVTLNQVLEWLMLPSELVDLPVRELVLDSRRVNSGDLFLALPGFSGDGRDYIEQAVASGACAVLAASGGVLPVCSVPVISVDNLTDRLGELASCFYQSPSESLNVIGVTGTNGKSSCCHFIAQLLQCFNESCGVMGTLGNGLFPSLKPVGNTTSDNVSIQQFMRGLVDKAVPWLTMEVSSHGLDQRRVAGVRFDSAVYTNLSRDHLDYHQTMDAYAEAKAGLFRVPGLRYAVINRDDDWAVRMMDVAMVNQATCITYSIHPKGADVCLSDIVFSHQGVRAGICTPWGSGALSTRLFGRFNLSNLLAVISVLSLHGFPLDRLLALIPKLDNVPGRLEPFGGDGRPTVVVDYAHTPDALRSVLGALRDHGGQSVTCVFGCGGDRDRGKRPLMTEAALTGADRVVLTSDNPRTEAPLQIIEDAMVGLSAALCEKRFRVVPDRSEAIAMAVAEADNHGIVLVAGMGREDYLATHGMNDVSEVRRALDRRLER